MGGTGPRTGYVLVLRLELSDTPGTLGRVTTAIGEDGGDIGNIDLEGQFGRKVLREVTVTCRNEAHARELTARVEAVDGVRVLEVGDRTLLAHQGGKLAVVPGVGRVSQAIAANPERVWDLTVKGNSVAVLTDGTAVVVLAALENACRVVGKRLAGLRVVVLGAGAAGLACARLLLHAGVRDLAGADVFIGLSGPGALPPALAATMAPEAIVFALANPVPEILPEEVPPNVAVVATGRSDFPNQINNVLVFPGFFRGLLDARARTVTDDMKAAAARGLASLVADRELSADFVIPPVFDRRVAPAVSRAVQETVERAGLSRLVESG